jgi:hypothetical protein
MHEHCYFPEEWKEKREMHTCNSRKLFSKDTLLASWLLSGRLLHFYSIGLYYSHVKVEQKVDGTQWYLIKFVLNVFLQVSSSSRNISRSMITYRFEYFAIAINQEIN